MKEYEPLLIQFLIYFLATLLALTLYFEWLGPDVIK